MRFRFQETYPWFGFLVKLQLIIWMMGNKRGQDLVNVSLKACADARASPQQHHQDAGKKASEDNKGHLVYVDELNIQPSYENSVNPFLSHVEQARNKRLNPIHNHRKHLKIQFSKNKINAFAIDEYDDDTDSINYPLEVDPEKPHFMEEDSYADATAEDTKDFGDEEKNFKNMLDVLFSSDY